MQPLIEPNADMPWEIYLDFLQDQGNEDLRNIDIFSFISGYSENPITNRSFFSFIYQNDGDGYGTGENTAFVSNGFDGSYLFLDPECIQGAGFQQCGKGMGGG